MQNQNKCLGCGAIKQTTNPLEVGYVKSLEHEYCLDCFQLAHYGKTNKHYHPNNYSEIKEKSLIFIIQSIMQLDLLFTQPITRIQPNAKYVYIINQIDLLPKDINLGFIHHQLLKYAKDNNVTYHDIILMSALNKNDIENLKEYIMSEREKDIYLFGFQNSGKSTILKALTNNEKVLSINKAGLTQETIIEDFNNKKLYDMPGTYVSGYLSDFFEYEKYRKMLPKKTLKPKVYQLKNTQKLVISDFIEITFDKAEKISLVLYLNDFNTINKYNINNKENHLTDDLSYTTKSFPINGVKKQITIGDLLFMHVVGDCNITIKLPKKMHITIMGALMK
ncbi:GTPase [Haploplasma axanthum]|uniref:GTPase n=2 Tax=Haploplasma axanthum TaxID=29552 RepID=UPI00138B163E|nr:GTPase [Haploplasma axanthum]